MPVISSVRVPSFENVKTRLIGIPCSTLPASQVVTGKRIEGAGCGAATEIAVTRRMMQEHSRIAAPFTEDVLSAALSFLTFFRIV